MGFVQGMLATWPGRIFAVALAVAVVGGAVVASRINAAPAKADLRTATVTRGAVTQSVAVSGSVTASQQLKLNFKTGGKLTQLMVSVGQQVQPGQVLATLDTADLANAVAQARVNLQSAQARYDQVVSGASPEDVASAQQSLVRIQSGYTSQKSVWQQSSSGARSDAASVIGGLDPLQSQLQRILQDLSSVAQPTPTPPVRPTERPPQATQTPIPTPNTATADARSAYNAVLQAQSALSNAQAFGVDQLWAAIGDYTSASLTLGNAIAGFDAAIAGSGDTGAASTSFQTAQANYSSASSRLSSVIDAVGQQATAASQSLSSAQASLNNGGSKYDPTLDAARADLSSAQAMVSNASLTSSSAKNKLAQANTSLQTVADAVTGSYINALNNLAKTAATPKPADIASAAASVSSAQVSLDSANTNLANATLTSPSTGVVASISNQVGEFVGSGGTTGFIVLATTGTLTLHGTIGEADVAKLRLGQVANVTVDALGANSRLTGRVTSLDPVATIQQGVPVYGVDVTIDLLTQALRPGMSGTAQVIIASKQGVLTVPNLAIRSQGGRRYVQVLKDGEAVDTEVTFGIANDTVTEVSSGLEEGQLVVLPQPRAGSTARPGGPGGPGFVQR
jgi:RND family efflux transporter MFP subunit